MNIQERIGESIYNTYTDMAYIIAEGKVGDWLTKKRKQILPTKKEKTTKERVQAEKDFSWAKHKGTLRGRSNHDFGLSRAAEEGRAKQNKWHKPDHRYPREN